MPRVGFAWQIFPRLVLRGGYGMTDDMEGTGVGTRLTQNGPFTSLFSYSPAAPTNTANGQPFMPVDNGFVIPSNANLGPSTPYSGYYAVSPNWKASVVQQYNLTLEYQLNSSTSARVGYVGENGQHLAGLVQANQWSTPLTANIADNNDCSGVTAPAAPWCTLVGNSGNVLVTQSGAISNYNALQAQLRHQTTANLEYTINYAWARAMTDDVGGFFGVGGVYENGAFYQNNHNPLGNYGPSATDVRQSLNANGVYKLPFGHGRKFNFSHMHGASDRVLDEAIGGWQLSGTAILYSGFPLTIQSPENYNVHALGDAFALRYRPLKIVHRTVQDWFGTDPSAIPCTTLNSDGSTFDNGVCAYGVESQLGFGNAQNGSERAPGFRQVDVAAFKIFKITESQSLELRGDAYNVGNIASYAPPNTNMLGYYSGTANTYGQITGTNSPPRQIQVSMHYRF